MASDPQQLDPSSRLDQAETQLEQVRRALETLRAGNDLATHASDEQSLLEGICEVLVQQGGYRLAWVGYALSDPDKRIEPMASAGFEVGYLEKANLSWADNARGRGPSGRAVRERIPVAVQDILHDPAFAPWREDAVRRGYLSSAAFPLLHGEACFGVLNIYAPEPNAFSADENSLLLELANSLAAGIGAIRARAAQEKAEHELRHSEQELRTIIDNLPDTFYRTNLAGEIVLVSRSVEQLLGWTAEELLGTRLADNYVDPEGREKFIAELQANGGTVIGYEAALRRKDGSIVWVSTSAHYYRDAAGNICGVEGTTRDVTPLKKHEAMLQQAAAVFENTADAVVISDRDKKVVAINRAFTEITGYEFDEIQGRQPSFLRPEGYDPAFYEHFHHTLDSAGHWRGEIVHRCRDGRLIPAWQTSSTIRDTDGEIINYVSVFSDITSLKESQQQLDHLAHHDPLTGLPNRMVFEDRLGHAIGHAKRMKHRLAVIFVDMDRFKNVNDSFGHPVGDKLLKDVADRLKGQVREDDTVARLGGDEFIILVDEVDTPQDAALLARKLTASFAEPFQVQGHDFQMTLSMGISLFPNDGADVATLIKNADAAMYRAKEEGRNDFQFYTTELTIAAFERLTLETALRRALEREEFRAYYQPQIELASGRLLGAEALIRWAHPDMGLISPDKFIPLAEETGLIVDIGEWILCESCRQICDWDAQGRELPRIGVNIAAAQIQRSGFSRQVASCLENSGLDGSRLELEITEGFIMQKPEHAVRTLEALRELEVGIAIDDFGTGYSSLSHLKRLPIDKLKIDRSFVRDIPDDPNDEAITLAIIAMAKSLRLKVIAEGVETEQQRRFLQQHGCTEGQGYLYARPLPAEEFAARWLS